MSRRQTAYMYSSTSIFGLVVAFGILFCLIMFLLWL